MLTDVEWEDDLQKVLDAVQELCRGRKAKKISKWIRSFRSRKRIAKYVKEFQLAKFLENAKHDPFLKNLRVSPKSSRPLGSRSGWILLSVIRRLRPRGRKSGRR